MNSEVRSDLGDPPSLPKPSAPEVRNAILDLIRSGAFKPGQRLPNERHLADQFGTTRSTLRDALLMIEQQELIERRIGSGTYLNADAHLKLDKARLVRSLDHDDVPNLAEILEARSLFEPNLCRLVIERAQPSDFQAMESNLEKIKTARNWLLFKEAIYSVHLSIYQATKNNFLIRVFELAMKYRRDVRFDGIDVFDEIPLLIRNQTYADLNKVVHSLKSRDVAVAEKETREYIARILGIITL